MTKPPFFAALASLLAVSASFAATSVELNGVVKTLSGKPLQGSCVALARAGFTTCTDSTGAWRMSTGGTVSVGHATLQAKVRPRIVNIDGGRLELRFGDFTVSGRALKKVQEPVKHRANGLTPLVSANRFMEAEVIDTLLYSWNGRIISRTPITSLVLNSAQTQALDTQSIKTDFRWNDTIKYSWLRDSRDGQMYRTVHIGTQHWMAQNANFGGSIGSDSVGVCNGNKLANCLIYGRLYTWNETFRGESTEDSAEFRICPKGWAVPSRLDWDTLMQTIGNNAKSICSRDGWVYPDSAGTDSTGLRILGSGGWSSQWGFLSPPWSQFHWGRERYKNTNSHEYFLVFGYGASWQFNTQEQGLKSSARCIEKKSMLYSLLN